MSVSLAFGLSIIWLCVLVAANGLYLLEAMISLFAIVFTLGAVLWLFPSLREEYDQAMTAFFHTGFGIIGSFLALGIIVFAFVMILRKRGGPGLKWLLISGAFFQLIVWESFSFLTAAVYLLAAFLPDHQRQPLEKRAPESVQ
ncbi:hypothetical protein [Bacillus sonorensis]|uniref:hypothetical protein n=1 Tax=Bacillus sonorensis TaxID=119858 RepID=UPI001F26ED3A|nr:hypothetical protein [Bacillus sonorensis]MCF7616762.1 hypothetical protein [Bacillus sonorensis]MCY8026336.1 hypothetical protein [Bacillus sonorensis]MCY8033809.1 hypothetical protein [Bacillus sonorensis]MCY8086135.1 hypothetical protein [Bacillus sonorensis]MCY8562495.1 hypothetical protein [Bacillus sonorensis]